MGARGSSEGRREARRGVIGRLSGVIRGRKGVARGRRASREGVSSRAGVVSHWFLALPAMRSPVRAEPRTGWTPSQPQRAGHRRSSGVLDTVAGHRRSLQPSWTPSQLCVVDRPEATQHVINRCQEVQDCLPIIGPPMVRMNQSLELAYLFAHRAVPFVIGQPLHVLASVALTSATHSRLVGVSAGQHGKATKAVGGRGDQSNSDKSGERREMGREMGL